MAHPGVHLGLQHGPYECRWDPEVAKRFGEATRDPSPLVAEGQAVPPVVLMTLAWEAQLLGRETIVNGAIRDEASGGAHGQHDLRVHRPLVAGEALTTWVKAYGSTPVGRHTLTSLYYPTYDEAGELVVEQWWTTIYVNVTAEAVGPPLPDHTFPEEARQHPAGTYDVFLDPDLPRRYAEVTGDWAPVHFDIEAARGNGFPGMTTHGLSTLALCSQGIVSQVADGDASRVERLAARFSSPALVGHDLHVRIYRAAPAVYVFEADLAGRTVVKHGRLELRD